MIGGGGGGGRQGGGGGGGGRGGRDMTPAGFSKQAMNEVHACPRRCTGIAFAGQQTPFRSPCAANIDRITITGNPCLV